MITAKTLKGIEELKSYLLDDQKDLAGRFVVYLKTMSATGNNIPDSYQEYFRKELSEAKQRAEKAREGVSILRNRKAKRSTEIDRPANKKKNDHPDHRVKDKTGI